MKITILTLTCFLFSCTSIKKVDPDLSSFYKLEHPLLSKEETKVLQLKIANKDICKESENYNYCNLLVKPVKEKKTILPYNKKNIIALQFNNWRDNYKAVKQKPENFWVKEYGEINKEDFCPKNLNATIVSYLDDNLDKVENRIAIDNYYQELVKCPLEPSQELIHLRMAIIYYNLKEFDKAKKAISIILNNPDDVTRVTYWAGIILDDKSYLEKLIKERPYSLHAIEASKKLNVDLYEVILSREMLIEERSNMAIFVESLVYYNFLDDAYTLINNNLNKLKAEELLYFVKLIDTKNRTDITLKLVTRSYIRDPIKFDAQFLNISYKTHILSEFKKYEDKVDPYLMLSLSKQESGFYERAQSPVKAMGLMQLMPRTARSISKDKAKDLYNIENNVFIGVNHYAELFERFNRIDYALASYNAGPTPVKEWIKNYDFVDDISFIDLMPYRETRLYVTNILRNHYFYAKVSPKVLITKISSEKHNERAK